jgi:hypothetical protein
MWFSLRPDTPAKVRRWIAEFGVEDSGRRILESPAEEFIEQLD